MELHHLIIQSYLPSRIPVNTRYCGNPGRPPRSACMWFHSPQKGSLPPVWSPHPDIFWTGHPEFFKVFCHVNMCLAELVVIQLHYQVFVHFSSVYCQLYLFSVSLSEMIDLSAHRVFIFVRDIQIIHVPNHYHLFVINCLFCNTPVVGAT